MANHTSEESPAAHPLFMVDDDEEDIPRVSSIHIARKENGKLLFAPRIRSATELMSLDQIHTEFGGGDYVLIAYDEGRIRTRKSISLPGKSKPMHDEGVEETPKPSQAVITTPPNPMSNMGGEGGVMGLIMMMMQQMMQQSAAAQASQTQMFIAMMQNQSQATSEEKQAARAELQANIERERISAERNMVMMKELMQARSGSGGSEDFTRGVEFMRNFATREIQQLKENASNGGESELSSMLETLGMVMQGVGMLKGVGGTPEAVAEAAEAVVQ